MGLDAELVRDIRCFSYLTLMPSFFELSSNAVVSTIDETIPNMLIPCSVSKAVTEIDWYP